MANSEQDIQSLIIDLLRHYGIFCWRNNSQGTFDPSTKKFRQMTGRAIKGVSDIIGVIPGGRALFIEVKTKIGKVSPEQSKFLYDANNKGALTRVMRSVQDALLLLLEIKIIDKVVYTSKIEALNQLAGAKKNVQNRNRKPSSNANSQESTGSGDQGPHDVLPY